MISKVAISPVNLLKKRLYFITAPCYNNKAAIQISRTYM